MPEVSGKGEFSVSCAPNNTVTGCNILPDFVKYDGKVT
jgi:hypothetical protein